MHYGNRLLDFAHPVNEAQLEDLLKACQPAQFGVDQPEARTMDERHFATHLSPADLGVVEIIHDILLQGHSNRRSIRVELSKLSVYGIIYLFTSAPSSLTPGCARTGPGAFSAATVDNRISDKMFGSLVVILPTTHEGGSLVVRQGQREWTFDTAKAMRDNPADNNASMIAAAFVAYFNDVEHEVTTVTSGYRVALTYSLYLRDPNLSASFLGYKAETTLRETLALLLENPSFLPDGGRLGFGLTYGYYSITSTPKDIEKSLKGMDAAIKRVCESLSLAISVKVAYRGKDDPQMVAVLRDYAKFSGYDVEDFARFMQEYCRGEIICDVTEGKLNPNKIPMVWVKPLGGTNSFSAGYIRSREDGYVEDEELCYAHGEVCLVAVVNPASQRNN